MSELPNDDAEYQATPAAEHEEIVSKLMQLLVQRDAIKFGKFPLRSGKTSHYWFDMNALWDGHDLFTIGRSMSITISHHFGDTVDVIFASGLDSMGVALAACQYYALLTGHGNEFGYYHPLDLVGEGPVPTKGGRLQENRTCVIVEDVLTSGDAIRQAIHAVKSTGATVLGVCVLFDRREKERGTCTATTLHKETGLKVVSCATTAEISKILPEEAFTVEQKAEVAKAR